MPRIRGLDDSGLDVRPQVKAARLSGRAPVAGTVK